MTLITFLSCAGSVSGPWCSTSLSLSLGGLIACDMWHATRATSSAFSFASSISRKAFRSVRTSLTTVVLSKRAWLWVIIRVWWRYWRWYLVCYAFASALSGSTVRVIFASLLQTTEHLSVLYFSLGLFISDPGSQELPLNDYQLQSLSHQRSLEPAVSTAGSFISGRFLLAMFFWRSRSHSCSLFYFFLIITCRPWSARGLSFHWKSRRRSIGTFCC